MDWYAFGDWFFHGIAPLDLLVAALHGMGERANDARC